MDGLAPDRLELLRKYAGGPWICDAYDLRAAVMELRDLGLIRPLPPEYRCDELTSAGRQALGDVV